MKSRYIYLIFIISIWKLLLEANIALAVKGEASYQAFIILMHALALISNEDNQFASQQTSPERKMQIRLQGLELTTPSVKGTLTPAVQTQMALQCREKIVASFSHCTTNIICPKHLENIQQCNHFCKGKDTCKPDCHCYLIEAVEQSNETTCHVNPDKKHTKDSVIQGANIDYTIYKTIPKVDARIAYKAKASGQQYRHPHR